MKHSKLTEQFRPKTQSAIFAAGLVGALAISFLPGSITQQLRNSWREALRPGLQALATTAGWASDRWYDFRSIGNTTTRQSAEEIVALSNEVCRLETLLLIARSDRNFPGAGDPSAASRLPSLFVSQAISARVLGRQAQSFLQSRDLLDVGRSHGITSQALVVENSLSSQSPQLVDQGRDAGINSGSLVLEGSRIWGKIVDVGDHTSTVRRVTDAGYRDLVQLATQRSGRLHFAARGLLAGNGTDLCKIDLVEASEPIALGDFVFSADDGVGDAPLLYGRVARLERKPGGANWEIWMEPALTAGSPPVRVAVVQLKINPGRLAAGP
ncbi:MAG TPA: rod shape-determining protein MreC [Pirellulales bacterium]